MKYMQSELVLKDWGFIGKGKTRTKHPKMIF